MQESHLQALRKKQWLYTNLLYLLYIIVLVILIGLDAPGWAVYVLIALIFLSSAVSILLFRQNQPMLLFFPEIRELARYEQKKLGTARRRYYMANLCLQFVLGLFSLSQAWVKSHQAVFLAGIPIWYLIITIVILVYLGNLNLHFHIRRFDQKSPEELIAFAKDQTLFISILVVVMLVFIVVGYFVVYVVFG